MGSVGDNISMENSRWSFGGEVPKHFDEHVQKSAPLYAVAHDLVAKMSDFFLPSGSTVYDLGCSTGTLIASLAKRHEGRGIKFVGCDIEDGMVEAARKQCSEYSNVSILRESALDLSLEKSNLIISFYTMMFIHPSNRQVLFDRIYEALNWGGAFLFFEKVRAPDARFQDIMSQIYNEYKLDQGYSPDEIVSKTRSLKGVLEPFSTQGNIDLAKRAGFQDIMSVFKYVCFEGFLAIK